MDFKQTLDSKIADYNLLNHPFYQAWSAGELPVEALRSYAREYGAFISMMPEGWETLNDAEIAAEETEHIDLWADFAAGLDTTVTEAQIPQVKALMETADELFSEPTTALGALYAFEAQQPATAQSKLAGLKAFYQLPKSVEPYFETHSHNEHEAEKLLAYIGTLPSDSYATVVQACEKMSAALWDALTGIHDAECA
ncbi:MAG: iron-containing redox enzyme family protein [Candidatus Poribacteria bacterium]|nr:iron-containing redox enzyme family protein [Candidatus Poribacteria bacterium]